LVRRKKKEVNNPWCASTLEWSIASPAPDENFAGQEPVVYRAAYEFTANGEEFAAQHLSPELLVQKVDD
jgi:heme/copper-type cytochrome/quinol oxidase subunit 1